MPDHSRPWTGGEPQGLPPYSPPQNVNLNITISLSPETATLLHGLNSGILAAITDLKETIMTKLDDFKVGFAAYTAKVDAYIAAANANQQTSDQLVAAALAAQQAGQDVDVQKLSDDLAVEAAKVPDAPTPPAPPAP